MSNPITDLLSNDYELDPNTNLPKETNPINDILSFTGSNIDKIRNVAPIQLGLYGPKNRRIGESRSDVNVLAEDIIYGPGVDYVRGENQSGLDQLGNMSMQFLSELVGGTIETVGYLFDLSMITGSLKEGEKEFGNSLSRLGTQIKEDTKEKFPIYSNAEGFAPGDWSWWMKNASSIASSFALMLPTGAIVGGINAATKAFNIATKLNKGIKAGLAIGGQAIMSRHSESMMEASGVYQELYDINITDGLNEIEARQNAAIGASSVYNKNWAMLGQDVLQYAFLAGGFKGIMSSINNAAKVAKATGKSVLPVYAKSGLKGLGNMLGEAGEEGYQFVVSEESMYLAQKALDPNIESDFSERMSEYMKDGEMWTSAFFGAIGAGFVQGTMKGVNAKLKKGPSLASLQVEDIGSWGAETARGYKTSMLAGEINNTNIAKTNQVEVMANLLTKSANIGNLGRFKDFAQTMSNPSKEDLETYGISEEDAAIISENAQEMLNSANDFEKKYENNLKKFNANKLKSLSHVGLATRNEFLLDKYKQRAEESDNSLQGLLESVLRFDKLSESGKIITGNKAKIKAIKDINKGYNYVLKEEEDSLTSSTISNYKNAIKANDKQISKLEEETSTVTKNRTKEEIENDKDINISEESLYDFQKEQSNAQSIFNTIERLENDLEKIYKGELPYKQEPRYKSIDDIQTEVEIPQKNDLVKYTNPANGEQFLAKVEKIEKESNYTIQTLSLDVGSKIGNPFVVSLENLELVVDSDQTSQELDPDDTVTDFERGDDLLGIGYFIDSLSYIGYDPSKTDPTKKERIVRDKEFEKLISNPNTDLSNAIVSFVIDKKYKPFWEKHQSLLKELKTAGLTQDRIDKLSSDILDNIPIKVEVTINGTKYSTGIYMHTTNANVIRVPKHIQLQGKAEENKFIQNQRKAARNTRYNILSYLLSGKSAIASGVNVSVGIPNNVNKSQNIDKAFNQNASDIILAAVDGNGVLQEGDEVEPNLTITLPKGHLFAKTNKTPNGKLGLIKLNSTKLSKEHADILFDAFVKKHTRNAGYMSDMKDDRVVGLSSGQVIQFLTHSGETQTSVDLPQNKNRLSESMRDKQLFVKKDPISGKLTLYYGSETVEFMSKKDYEENKKKFIEWAINNKNYASRIQEPKLGITGFNSVYDKSFKLGSIEHDGKSSYGSILIKNGLFKTDVEEYVPGSLYKEPVVKFDSDSIHSETIKKQAPKKTISKKEKEVIAEFQTNDNLYSLKSKEDLSSIPEGAEIYTTTYEVLPDKTKVPTNLLIGSIVKNKKGNKIFKLDDSLKLTEAYKPLKGLSINDTSIVDYLLDNLGLIRISDIKSTIDATEHQVNDIKEQPTESIKLDRDPLDISLNDDDDILREYGGSYEYEQHDLNKELKKIRNMLGKRVSNDFVEVDKLINVFKQGKVAFANYRHDAITIYNASEKGTSYHEAYHRVSLAYLTPKEREELYDSARREYQLRGLSDREVEETLAERFREYILERKSNMSVVEKVLDNISTFFKRLYNNIYTFIMGPHRLTSYEVDKIFRDIYFGKYKNSKLLKENQNNLIHEFNRSIYGTDFNTIDNMDVLRSLVKGFTYELIKLNKYTDFDNLKTLDFLPLINKIELLINKYKTALSQEGLTEIERNILSKRLDLFTEVLGYNEKTKEYESFGVMKELIYDYLTAIDLNPFVLKDPNEYNDVVNNLSISEFDRQSFEVSPKQNSRGNVKVLVGLLPKQKVIEKDGKLIHTNVKNPITNIVEFVDYNEAWDTLLGDLYDLNNIDDMLLRLEELVEIRPYYKVLLSRLNKNKDNLLKSQFEATIRKHRNSFVNAIFKIGQDKLDFTFSDGDVRSVSKNKLNEWNLNFYLSENVNKKEEFPYISNEFYLYLNKLQKELSSKVNIQSKIPSVSNKISAYYPKIQSILSNMGIVVDNRTLDHIVFKGPKDIETNFLDLVNVKLPSIINKTIKNHNPKSTHASILYTGDNAVRFFGDAYAKAHPEEMNNMVLGPGNAQYYSFSNHSTVTSLIRDFKISPDLAANMLQYRFNNYSRFLAQIALDKNIRDKLTIKTFAGIYTNKGGDQGRDYFGMNQAEDYIIKLHANLNNWVSFPTISDKKTYYFLDGLETIPVDFVIGENGKYKISDNTINELYKQVENEYNRIKKAREDRDLLNSLKNSGKTKEYNSLAATMVENYHHVNGDYTKGNAYDFVAFKGFSYDSFNEDQIKEQLPLAIISLLNKELDFAHRLNIIFKDENDQWDTNKIDSNILNKAIDKYGSKHAAIVSIFTEHVIKNVDNSIELHKLFIGDPAFYKKDKETNGVEVNLGKRLGELIASGEEMSQTVDNFGESLLKSNFSVSTIKTQKLKSAYHDDLLKSFTNIVGATKAKELLKPYTELEQADGQTFVTPSMYRSISIRIGEWSPSKEMSYNLLISDEKLTVEEEREAFNVVLNPLKTVYFGYDIVRDIAVPIYDKMSMAPLFRRAIKGKQIEQLLDRMEGVGEYSNQQPIDMIKIDSATKVGNMGAKPLFKDTYQSEFIDLNTLNIHNQSFKNLRRQTVVPIHEKERTNVGTQFLKIAGSNIQKEEVYLFKGKEIKGKDLISIISKSLANLAKKGKQNIDSKFGVKDNKINKKYLAHTMRREAKLATQPMSLIETLHTVDGEMYMQPDSYPNRSWFESRMISIMGKDMIERNMPGGQFVQVSNLGFREPSQKEISSEKDRISWLKEEAKEIPFITYEDGNISSMGCVVSVSLFKSSIPNYENKSFAEKQKYIVDNKLEILGYRIPTQGQNSTVPMVVVGLLPEASGESIILPSEFTALTGSDFDIDKLFLIRKNYTFGSNDVLKEVSFIENNDERAYRDMAWYLFSVYKRQLSPDFLETYYAKDFDRIERNKALNFAFGENLDRVNEIYVKIDSYKRLRKEAETKERQLEYTYLINDLYYEINQLKVEKEYLYSQRDLTKSEKVELSTMIKEELVSSGFLQTFEEFKNLNVYDKNTPAAIENRLFDAYHSILTSPLHFINTTSPLGGFVNELKDMSNKVRSLYTTEESSNMSMFSPRFQSEMKLRYSSGKSGIGPFALHNSHHVLTQFANYSIIGGVSPLQKYKEVKSKVGETMINVLDLSIITGSDGVNVLDWLSALIDSHVDLANDPFIVDLNINEFTYDAIAYLIRTGVGRQAFKFMSMEGIKMVSEEYFSTRESAFNKYPSNKIKVINDTIDSLLRKVGADTYSDIEESISSRLSMFLTGDNNAIENKHLTSDKIVKNKEYWLDQIAAIKFLETIKEDADILTNDVQSSQIDSKKYGTSLSEIEHFMSKVISSYSNSINGKTYGFEKLIPYSEEGLYTEESEEETFIAGYYRHGLSHMLELMGDMTLSSTVSFRDTVYELIRKAMPTGPITKEHIRRTSNELWSAIIAKYVFANKNGFNLNSSNIKALLFQENNNIFSRFSKLKSENPELFESNKFLKRLNVVHDPNSELGNYFISKNLSFKDSMEIDDVIYSWEDLLKSDNPEIEKLARHLFLYSFYTTGFNNRIHGFNSLIPPSMMKGINVGERTVSLDSIVKVLLKKMVSPDFKFELLDVIDDVLSHQSYMRDGIDAKLIQTKIKDNLIYTPQSENISKLRIGISSDKKYIHVPYIKTKNAIYKYRGYIENSNNTPIYTLENKRGHFNRGLFLHEYGLKESVLNTNRNENRIETITKQLSNSLSKHFGGNFVQVNKEDIYFNKLNKEIEIETDDETIDTTNINVMKTDKLTNEAKPIKIFTDGSDIKGTGKIGSGAWLQYNGKSYESSTVKTSKQVREEFNIPQDEFESTAKEYKTFSNGIMETYAIYDVLKQFENKGEHLHIYSDGENSILQIKKLIEGVLQDKDYFGEDKYSNNAGNQSKNIHAKYINKEIVSLIKGIRDAGGTVKITKVKAHSNILGNDAADLTARSTVVKNNIPSLFKLVTDVSTESAATLDKLSPLMEEKTEEQQGEEIKKYCKG